ncbi:probable signal peptidase complex subunit 2 [Tetranychus urticae]|uniref:Signal peptidase complex subunit 2 n=1 Tax=Tetranychus urticae TaxID=32264 RepID=T1K284_TETUR|nr:probable signal peptidase complex subunit 2 [Tetranychus urticae]
MEPIKIDKWDCSALKNTLDDCCRNILIDKYKYAECHKLMDIRLAICTAAVACAAFALVYDYLYAFPASKLVLITCSSTYFILMGVLTLYTNMVEKGIFLVAKQVDSSGNEPAKKITVSSCLKRFDENYQLCFEYNTGKKGAKTKEKTITKSVANWFDEDGQLLYDSFKHDVVQLHDSIVNKKDL